MKINRAAVLFSFLYAFSAAAFVGLGARAAEPLKSPPVAAQTADFSVYENTAPRAVITLKPDGSLVWNGQKDEVARKLLALISELRSELVAAKAQIEAAKADTLRARAELEAKSAPASLPSPSLTKSKPAPKKKPAS